MSKNNLAKEILIQDDLLLDKSLDEKEKTVDHDSLSIGGDEPEVLKAGPTPQEQFKAVDDEGEQQINNDLNKMMLLLGGEERFK